MTFLLFCFCLPIFFQATAADTPADSGEATRRSINLEALSRLKGIDLEANPAVKEVIMKILEQVRGTPQFVEIVRDFNIKGEAQPLLELAAKDPEGPAGVEAMRLVLRNDELSALKTWLGGTNSLKLIQALGNTGEKEIVPILLPILSDQTQPIDVHKQAVRSLAKVQEGAAALIELARAQKLPDDVRPTARSELNSVRWENLKAQAAELLPLPKSQNARPLPPIAELIKLKGDLQKGAAVFRRDTVGCLKCHQINGEGVDFGPNLSEIGTKLAKDAIYESLLDPSAGIAFGYEAWQIDLKNGDDALGLIVSETPDEIALKAVGGLVTRYKKSDIARRTKQKLSIMPAGLEQTMTGEELVDLVEYLSSLKHSAR
jgi:putative heme-binding domain-containing protein